MALDAPASDPKVRRITVSWVSGLGMYRAYFTDNEGEGPYGEGYSEPAAVRDLYYNAEEAAADGPTYLVKSQDGDYEMKVTPHEI
jgi:hypothetical protein